MRRGYPLFFGLLLDAKRRLIGLELALNADLLVEIVPAIDDGLDSRLLVDLAGEEAAIASSSTTC